MNRIVLFGVAIFFAVVGVALIGGEESANAGLLRGNGCGGCDGGSGDCGGAAADCCGRKKLFDGCHGRDRCSGRDRCCGREKCSGGLFSHKCGGREKCHGLFGKRCGGDDCCGPVDACECGGGKVIDDKGVPAPADAPPAPPAEEKAA